MSLRRTPESSGALRGASALAVVLAVALAVAGCTDASSGPTATATGTTSTGAGPSSPTSTDLSATSTDSTAPTATDPTALPTTGGGDEGTAPSGAGVLPTSFVTVEQTINDPAFGHQITVTKIARNMAWPPGHAAEAAVFELVGVEMHWTPGTAFTATIRAQDFALITGSTYPNRPDATLDPTLTAAAWSLLPATAGPGQDVTGWMIFKVEPAGAPTMRLDYLRPAIKISGTSTVYAKALFSITLVPTPAVSSSVVLPRTTTTKPRTTTTTKKR